MSKEPLFNDGINSLPKVFRPKLRIPKKNNGIDKYEFMNECPTRLVRKNEPCSLTPGDNRKWYLQRIRNYDGAIVSSQLYHSIVKYIMQPAPLYECQIIGHPFRLPTICNPASYLPDGYRLVQATPARQWPPQYLQRLSHHSKCVDILLYQSYAQ